VNVGSGAAATNINFSLPSGTTISGTVTTKGTPLAHIDIDIFASNREFLRTYPAKTTANGTYRVGALPPGTYFLRADPKESQPYARSFYGGSRRVTGAKPIVLGSTPVTGIDISLEPRDPGRTSNREEQ